MTCKMRHSEWQSLIEPESRSNRCILKYKRPTVWTECSRFGTPEEAADAVAKGKTGQKEWDDLEHGTRTPLPGIAGWPIDPAAGPLSAIAPIVPNLLKTAILPPTKQPGDAS